MSASIKERVVEYVNRRNCNTTANNLTAAFKGFTRRQVLNGLHASKNDGLIRLVSAGATNGAEFTEAVFAPLVPA